MSIFDDTAPARDRVETVDEAILRLWGEKLDTVAISRRLGCLEHVVANRLAALRDAGRR
ncbi:hypothetical protein [Bradyrhizobium sp. USDA 4452]